MGGWLADHVPRWRHESSPRHMAASAAARRARVRAAASLILLLSAEGAKLQLWLFQSAAAVHAAPSRFTMHQSRVSMAVYVPSCGARALQMHDSL